MLKDYNNNKMYRTLPMKNCTSRFFFLFFAIFSKQDVCKQPILQTIIIVNK